MYTLTNQPLTKMKLLYFTTLTIPSLKVPIGMVITDNERKQVGAQSLLHCVYPLPINLCKSKLLTYFCSQNTTYSMRIVHSPYPCQRDGTKFNQCINLPFAI